MKIGFIIVIIGLFLSAYGYLAYKKADKKLAEIKKEDLVSYYIDLALYLIPVPFWSFVIGIVSIIIGIIVILASIPLVL